MAARTSPFSTYKTYLYHGGTKLIDIKDFTEPYAEREPLDTTTVSSDERTFRPGIRNRNKPLAFNCNYTKDKFNELKLIEDGKAASSYSIRFGDGGADGIFTFTAFLSVNIKPKGVNEVVEMVVTLFPTSAVSFS